MTKYTLLGTYVPYIILFVIIILGTLVIFSSLGINFNIEESQKITHEINYNTEI